MHLELKREHKEDKMKVGESKVYYQVISKILSSLEGGYTSEGSEKETVGTSKVYYLRCIRAMDRAVSRQR